MRERYSRSGDNAKMKAFTFARNKDDLTDNSRTPTGTKIYFRSPSPSQNSLVLKFPNGMKDEKIERLPASELERLLSHGTHGRKVEKSTSQRQFPVLSPVYSAQYTAILK